MINLFSAMMEGRKYNWRANTETTIYFITHIGADYGKERMINALRATQENIKYFYEQRGNKSGSIRRGCRKLTAEHGIDVSFGDEIFVGIIPKTSSDAVLTADTAATRYWLYAAGDGSTNWESDYAAGIMAIGWPELGDLMNYSSKEEMRNKMRKAYGGNGSYRNQVLSTWQFANEIKPGDVVFVKKGLKKVVGRGIVEGEYTYDEQRGEYCHTRKVRWTDKGEWEHPELKVYAPQINWAVTDGYSFQLPTMQTDIVLSSTRSQKTLIIDAKYYSHNMQMKAPYTTRTIHSANLYQIFTYVKNWPAAPNESVAGMLLYAGTDDEVQPNNDYQISGNTISVKPLIWTATLHSLRKSWMQLPQQWNHQVNRYKNSAGNDGLPSSPALFYFAFFARIICSAACFCSGVSDTQ